jgi:hypothetical protein
LYCGNQRACATSISSTIWGISWEHGQRRYDYDNRKRHNHCLFQYTFAGEGWFQTYPRGKAIRLTPGQGFLVPFPSPTRYWLAPGAEWEFCYILIKGEMGVSPHAHLQQFRLQRALNQITTTELPIKQIALESGYRDFAYFCKEFKRWTHKTPMSARRIGDQLNLSAIHTE